jgi:hypothetical protein
VPCSTLTHLLELDQQIAAWQRAHANLVPGGRFVVDLAMPNLRLYAQSMLLPPTIGLELDIDEHAAQSGDRLIRYRATRYTPHQQQATVWFLYDRFDGSQVKARMVSDFVGHVYFPREVELLYRIAGFRVVCRYGDYHFHRLSETSRSMIMIGEREPHDA